MERGKVEREEKGKEGGEKERERDVEHFESNIDGFTFNARMMRNHWGV